MKNTFVFASLIAGMLLLSGFASAALQVTITPNPIPLAVNSTVDAVVDVDSAPETAHIISIYNTICKDTDGNKNTCEEFLGNNDEGNTEFNVVFSDGNTTIETNSDGTAGLKIIGGQNASLTANYLFIINVDNTGWQVASATGESSAAIPEFPTALMPVILSLAGFGLVASRKLR